MLYPQQNDCRNTFDLSGLWDFALDPEGVGAQQDWFNDLHNPRAIAVPGSWNEQFQDARDYMGTAWYLRRFYVSAPPSMPPRSGSTASAWVSTSAAICPLIWISPIMSI